MLIKFNLNQINNTGIEKEDRICEEAIIWTWHVLELTDDFSDHEDDTKNTRDDQFTSRLSVYCGGNKLMAMFPN